MFSFNYIQGVSTHSRLKAAGFIKFRCSFKTYCFNTQPPEGGWDMDGVYMIVEILFQHTAA